MEVRALSGRLQEAAGGGPAQAPLLVHMEIGGAFIVAGVEVRHRGYAHVAGGAAHGVEDGPGDARGLDTPFAAGGVMVARPKEMILDAAEDGQHV